MSKRRAFTLIELLVVIA
ncbi:MAG: prepilin-type N-terminal cleavage/methylation domain-containing protein, partial [Planctomycetota bacterium]